MLNLIADRIRASQASSGSLDPLAAKRRGREHAWGRAYWEPTGAACAMRASPRWMRWRRGA